MPNSRKRPSGCDTCGALEDLKAARRERAFSTALRGYQQQSPWRIMWARFLRNYTHTVTWRGIVVKSLRDRSPMPSDPDHAAGAERSLEATRYEPHYACVRETIVAMKRLADPNPRPGGSLKRQ